MTPVQRTPNRNLCPVCKRLNDGGTVLCDGKCGLWYHFECVKITEMEAKMMPKWFCDDCKANYCRKNSPPAQSTCHSVTSGKYSSKSKISQKSSLKDELLQQKSELIRRQRQEKFELMKREEALFNEQKERMQKLAEEIQELTTQEVDVIEQQIKLCDEEILNDSRDGDFDDVSLASATLKIVHGKEKEIVNKSTLRKTKSLNIQATPYEPLEKKFQTSKWFTENPTEAPTCSPREAAITEGQRLARKVMPQELPIFSGKVEEWPLFISAFDRTTMACGLTNEENLIRLQKCLKGNAKQIVECQLYLPSCVPKIITTLKNIFGRPELIFKAQRDKIRKLTPVRYDKLETLVKFSTSVNNLCATMKASGLELFDNDVMLIDELLEKLPSNMKMDWIKHKQSLMREGSVIGVTTLGEWLENEAMCACEFVAIMDNVNEYPMNSKMDKKLSRMNVHVYDESNETTRCKVCQDNCRSISDCRKFKEMSLSEKWEVIKELRICKQCLQKHQLKPPYKCYNPVKCNKQDCNKKGHHPLLHDDSYVKKSILIPDSEVLTTEAQCSHVNSNQSVLFRYIPVVIRNGQELLHEIAFLDEGSTGTFIEEQTARRLGLNGPESILIVKWTSNMQRQEAGSMKVNLQISGDYEGAHNFTMQDIQTVKDLQLPTQSVDYEGMSKTYPYLKKLPIKSYSDVKPTILIGLKNWNIAVPLRVKEGKENQPIAAKCRLGWALFARTDSSLHKVNHCNFHIYETEPTTTDQDLHQAMKNYFAVDSIGIKIPPYNTASKEEQRAKSIMEDTTRKVSSHYETGLLFKYDHIKLPDSEPMALNRLYLLEKRLERNPILKKNVVEQFQLYESKGYTRKLSKDEAANHEQTWYLPVFPVINPNKPDKIRLVWDAAAKTEGISLNEILLKGPDQLASLNAILLRFRMKKIAVTGDIREMFHRVQIRKQDQHLQLFKWRNCEYDKEPDTYVMTAMTFGATCSPSSAQYVKNLNALRFKQEYPDAVNSIINEHYVDDYLESFDTVEEAINITKQVKYIHAEGGFEIRNFKSNSLSVLTSLNEQMINQNTSIELSVQIETQTEKVLGMWWIPATDEFTYSLKYNKGNQQVLRGERKPTKRELLRILMSIYDPLGLIVHYLNRLKMIIQEVWRSDVDWDEPIKEEEFKDWLEWVKLLPAVETIRIPRCYLTEFQDWSSLITQMHIFVDAGKDGSATVAYLRMQSENKVECNLVGGKTKVAPIKLTSVPRLELIAALIGARFARYLNESLHIPIHKTVFWTDSRTVLNWIRMDAKKIKGQFVAFRVAEIQEITDINQWRYCPTKLNIADEATKWEKMPSFQINSRWFKGPEFLYEDERNWPEIKVNREEIVVVDELVATHIETPTVIPVHKYSSFTKLVRIIAYIYRFYNNCNQSTSSAGLNDTLLTSNELNHAEKVAIKIAQAEAFSNEIRQLLQQCETISKSSPISSWLPYLDEDGLLRSNSRIVQATCVKAETIKPIILPRGHRITRLIMFDCHTKYHHQNHETVVNELRKRYAIPRIRQELKKVRAECQNCKNERARPIPPQMASLPNARLSINERPFTHTGVDYFGPISVTMGRRTEKRYGCLFTCLCIRAVHIEIAHDLSTDSFIMCYRNFIQRRGQPRHIYSDCGTNFIGAEKELKADLTKVDKMKLAKEFTNSELEWHFNPPASPHMGGSWERLVRSVKVALYKMMPSRNPTDQLLQSYLIEAEGIINSRPLTYLPLDSEESEALTPNHVLLGSSSGVKQIGHFSLDAKILKRNWETSQLYAARFRQRWIDEYLPTLTRRVKWCEVSEPIKVGDVVIIVDNNQRQNEWPKGRVVQVHQARDGQVRSAMVQTATGLYNRPTTKLAKLDIEQKSGTFNPIKN